MRIRTLFLATILGCVACSHPTLAGHWSLCVTSAGTERCTVAQVLAPVRPPATLRWTKFYAIRYKLDLRAFAGLNRPRQTGCGSLLLDQDSTYTLLLDIQCDGMWEADGGGLSAEFLHLVGDSLAGSWYQSCYAGCSARGNLVFKRADKRHGAA